MLSTCGSDLNALKAALSVKIWYPSPRPFFDVGLPKSRASKFVGMQTCWSVRVSAFCRENLSGTIINGLNLDCADKFWEGGGRRTFRILTIRLYNLSVNVAPFLYGLAFKMSDKLTRRIMMYLRVMEEW